MVKSRRVIAAGLLLWLVGSACNTRLDPSLDGLACRTSAPECLPGYVCSADRRCVRDGSTPGAGGAPGDAGGGAGAAGAAGASPQAAGGSAGAEPDASSGGYRYDAGPGLDVLDASVFPDAAGCDVPVPLFRDEDEDGYGVDSQEVLGCPAPRWALVSGDCRDDLKDVHPDQTAFFEVGYPDDRRPEAGNVSFDYDCDTSEELQQGTAAAPTCNELLTCAGSGYVPVNPIRTGPGINGVCGSTAFVTCQSRAVPLLGLTCEAVSGAPATAARCR